MSAVSSRVTFAALLCAGIAGGALAVRRENQLERRVAELEQHLADIARQSSVEAMRELVRGETSSATAPILERERAQRDASQQRESTVGRDLRALNDRTAALEGRLEDAALDQLRARIDRWHEQLAAVQGRIDQLKIPEEQDLLAQAAATARSVATTMVAEVKQSLEAMRADLPTRQQIADDLVRELRLADQAAMLAQARRLLGLPADIMQTIGLAQLFAALDAAAFLKDLREYLATIDPDRSPETMRLSLALLAQAQDARFHMLLLEAASGTLNARLVPQALVALSTVDLTTSAPEMARLALAGVLQAPLIDDPDRFNTIIDVVRAAVGTKPSADQIGLAVPGEQHPPLRQTFLRFYRNYLGSRLLGIDAAGAVFPITSVESLSVTAAPQLSASNRERALYLCKVARALGLEREAGRFLISLASKLSPARTSGDEQPRVVLVKLLEELSGQKLGEDWGRWLAWADR
ncbi:MAG: hypothetical protein U1E76_09055 [Planctomycetota bacterium]